MIDILVAESCVEPTPAELDQQITGVGEPVGLTLFLEDARRVEDVAQRLEYRTVQVLRSGKSFRVHVSHGAQFIEEAHVEHRLDDARQHVAVDHVGPCQTVGAPQLS
jgi:hypothetical protein